MSKFGVGLRYHLRGPALIGGGKLPSTPSTPSVPGLSTAFDALYDPAFKPINNRAFYTRLAQTEPATKSTGRASASYIDGRFGSRIYRVANPTDTSPTATDHLVPQYSRRNQFNCDGSKFLLKGSGTYFWVYDAATFERINAGHTNGAVGNGTISMRDGCEYAWHPTDPNKIIFSAQNGGLIFWEHDVVTGVLTVKFDLTGRFAALGMGTATNVWTGNDGHPSDDRRYWGWMVRNGTTFLGLAVYDMTTDTLTGQAMTGDCSTCSMSAKGGYIVAGRSGSSTFAAAQAAGHTNLVGTRAYTRDFSSFKQMHQGGQHADCGIDKSGNEVFVGVIYTADLMPDVTTGYVFYRDMATGVAQDLYSVWDGTITGTHISCTGTTNPGWVICSSFKDTISGETGWPDQNIIAVELAPDPMTLRLAHVRTTAGDYWAQPHASVSADGTQILFGQEWTGGTSIPLAYLVGLPSWAYDDQPPTDPPATNLIANGTFEDATGWTLGAGMAVSGGTLNFSGAANVTAGYNLTIPAGTYTVDFDILNYAGITGGNVQVRVNTTAGLQSFTSSITGDGAKSVTFTTTAESIQFQFRVTLRNANPLSMSIDNVVLTAG